MLATRAGSNDADRQAGNVAGGPTRAGRNIHRPDPLMSSHYGS